MRKPNILLIFFLMLATAVTAQDYNDFNRLTDNGDFTSAEMRNRRDRLRRDSAKTNTEVPERLNVWTIDERYGDVIKSEPDTLQYLFMNTQFTSGIYGEYNTLGNLGAPRQNRIFIDRAPQQQFVFMNPYRYIDTPIDEFLFTNTLSPITNISFYTCGNKTNGEDHIDAKFAANVGKAFGFGMRFNYLYGRGYYQNQPTSHFNYTAYCSYLGERYNLHFLVSTNHEKVSENGGITRDEYITNPERFEEEFNSDEIPVTLNKNWNRNDNIHLYLSHRYSLGFNRKVKMTEEEIKARKFALASKKENEALEKEKEARKKAEEEGIEFDEEAYRRSQSKYQGRPGDVKSVGKEPEVKAGDDSTRIAVNGPIPADSLLASATAPEDTTWLKNEYVPVTSFIHTARFDTYRRIYQAYETPENYYAEQYNKVGIYEGDSIYDMTRNYSIKNTVAVAMLEGFNKWVPMGLKLFVTSDLRHFSLPDSLRMRNDYNEHHLSVGGTLSKHLGKTFHYDVTAETWITGEDAGMLHVDGSADMNFRLFGDTLRLDARAFVHRNNPSFYFRHFHGAHAWWDNEDMEKEIHSHIEGQITYPKTKTTLRAAFDMMKNHTYLANTYDVGEEFNRFNHRMYVRTSSENISVLTLSLAQKLRWGILNFDNVFTYQKSSNEDVLPLPTLNVYSNLYLNLSIAKVLRLHLGADMRYFTEYAAPDYNPYMGQFVVQDNEHKVEIGSYPIINVYANMHLKRTRFFLMYTHVNKGSGNGMAFLSPHYPINGSTLRFGLSWNFIN